MIRYIFSALAVTLLVAGGVSGQAQRPPATIDDLLSELRALRANLNELSGASIRAQLLVGRLQLQEGRINTLGRELIEVRQRIAGHSMGFERLRDQVNQFEEAIRSGDVPAEQRRDFEAMLKERRAELLRFQREEEELRGREAEVSGLLAAEQARWTDFNSRLDELERALSLSR